MKNILAKIGTAATILATPTITFAQFERGDLGLLQTLLTPLRPPQNTNFDPFGLIVLALNIIIFVAALLAILYLIWAGIQYITASTDEEKAKKARTAIYNAIIGIVVIVLSYVIISYVSNIAKNTVTGVSSGSAGTGQFNPNSGIGF